MIIIKSLKEIAFDSIYQAFKEAFVDYEMQLEKEELERMLQRRGFVPELSFAAFEEDRIVSFTLNGIGFFNDLKTAYDTGTGTIKEYRGQGLATQVFKYSEPILKNAGISQYLLEVLQNNVKAFSIYKNMGFKISREFGYYIQKTEEIEFCSHETNSDFRFIEIDLEQIKKRSLFWDFTPSWQNNFEAISRNLDNFKIIGTFEKNMLIAYCIFEPKSGDISQITVDRNYRRKGIATELLKHSIKLNLNHSIKVINTDINCSSLNEFLKSNHILQSGKQYEMIKEL